VKLEVIADLRAIPEAFTGLSTLTLLNLTGNYFKAQADWPWWPTTLSR
jgi:hypothetical protein